MSRWDEAAAHIDHHEAAFGITGADEAAKARPTMADGSRTCQHERDAVIESFESPLYRPPAPARDLGLSMGR